MEEEDVWAYARHRTSDYSERRGLQEDLQDIGRHQARAPNARHVVGIWDLNPPGSCTYMVVFFSNAPPPKPVYTPWVSAWPFRHAPSSSRPCSSLPYPFDPSTFLIEQGEQSCPIFVAVDMTSIAHTHMVRAKTKRMPDHISRFTGQLYVGLVKEKRRWL
ncbi:hypothetical protein PQX77_010469 [Marasmius sp. AFHP31]|nr:hypothetical protein PQX77_010469 [Marasmius sp. AFHP31]